MCDKALPHPNPLPGGEGVNLPGAPARGTPPDTRPPGGLCAAWYDLSVRIGEAQAVASCALESLPGNLKGLDCARINHSSNLIAAVQDILTLMEADANLIENQLKA